MCFFTLNEPHRRGDLPPSATLICCILLYSQLQSTILSLPLYKANFFQAFLCLLCFYADMDTVSFCRVFLDLIFCGWIWSLSPLARFLVFYISYFHVTILLMTLGRKNMRINDEMYSIYFSQRP